MLPNLLVIGAEKAGTTAIHQFLGEHPQIFMSAMKEPGYFVFKGTKGKFPGLRSQPFVADIKTYENLFARSGDAKVIGESSPQYLEFARPEIVHDMLRTLPSFRVLAIIRQPIDQAYSKFVMLLRDGRLGDQDFRAQFFKDYDRFYSFENDFEQATITRSNYNRLRIYCDLLPQSNIKIMFYDDMVRDLPGFLREIYEYLEVNSGYRNEISAKPNPGRLYRYSGIATLMNRPNPVRWLARRLVPSETRLAFRDALLQRFSKPAPKLDPTVRAELTELLADEITNLETLTGRDLSAWRHATDA